MQGCGVCGETITSRLEDINHQLVLLTNILIGSSASSSRGSLERDVESSSTSRSSLERGSESYNDEETYHAGSGHPSYLDLTTAFSREHSVMREILSAEELELPSPSPPPADDAPPQSQGRSDGAVPINLCNWEQKTDCFCEGDLWPFKNKIRFKELTCLL